MAWCRKIILVIQFTCKHSVSLFIRVSILHCADWGKCEIRISLIFDDPEKLHNAEEDFFTTRPNGLLIKVTDPCLDTFVKLIADIPIATIIICGGVAQSKSGLKSDWDALTWPLTPFMLEKSEKKFLHGDAKNSLSVSTDAQL